MTSCSASSWGDQLFLVGGFSYADDPEGGMSNILQIYDIPSRTWRMGTSKSDGLNTSDPLVVDGKLIRVDRIEVVYDPQFDTWTQSLGPRQGWNGVRRACTHNGRAVVFFSDGLVLERDTDGSWSPYDVEEGIRAGDRNQTVFGSVLLG